MVKMNFMVCTPHQITSWATKSRRIRWEGHVARMGKRKDLYRVYGGEI